MTESRGLVLAVDDEPDFRLLLSELLADAGYRVATAPDGQSALARVADEMPALILLDMRMRGMDGPTFLREFRQRYGVATPVVLLTAGTEISPPIDLAGAGDVLIKPFDIDDLLSTLNRLLPA